MKLCYTLILIFTEILIALTIFRIFSAKNENLALSQKIFDLLVVGFFTVFPNIFITHVTSEFMAMIFFSWYFCFIDILLFLLLYFSVEYAFPNASASRRWYEAFYVFFRYDVAAFFQKKKQRTTWFEKMMLAIFLLVAADIAQFVPNIFSHAVFSVESFYSEGGFFAPDVYYRIIPNFPYDIHLSLSYIIVLLTFVGLVHKAVLVPSFYKTKYFGLVFFIAVIVLVNSFYVLFEIPVDFSVVLYGLFCVLIYHFSFNFIPKYLWHESIVRVIQNMNNGMLIFDNEDKCIFMNDYIKKIYDIKSNQNMENFLRFVVAEFAEKKRLSECAPFERTVSGEFGGKSAFYRQSFSHLKNAKQEFVGSYFIFVDVTKENMREKSQRFRNTHDLLTGIYNKESFYEKAALMLETNPDKKYYIICSDIGNFKLINEIYGITEGNKVLKLFALNLQEKSVAGEVYGRIDNDRFALLMPKERLDLKYLIDTTDQILRYSVNLVAMPICYFGVYEVEDLDMHISLMCDRAFAAIGTIKGQYEKHVAWYDSALRDTALREQKLMHGLSEAISTEQIKIYLQPQFTQDGKAVGAEALIRWEHPDEGLISPAEFIPIFEKNGMIAKVDRHVWNLVFKKLAEWKSEGHDDFYISVNLSPRDFYLMDINQEFSDLFKEYDINPKNLHIEITETIMMMNLERQMTLVEKLRKLGFVIEIGDFGVGYSSLKMLRDCDIEILKFDMEFLSNTRTPRNAYIIMKQFVTMAHSLGTKIVAKGIEYKEQVELLATYGCDLFQGYYFSKPIEISMFEKIYL